MAADLAGFRWVLYTLVELLPCRLIARPEDLDAPVPAYMGRKSR